MCDFRGRRPWRLHLQRRFWGGGRALAQLDSADPWPKFGQNEKNNCRTSVRGPHSVPELRWWAPAGFGATITGGYVARSGAAIADINGVRCIVVPGTFPSTETTPQVTKLQIFRFHPCHSPLDDEEPYDPSESPAEPIAVITVSTGAEKLLSTPLITEDNYVVVQTTERVRCYDLNDIDATASCDTFMTISQTPVWEYPGTSEVFESEAASPAAGRIGAEGDKYIVVVGRITVSSTINAVRVAWLDPATGHVLYESTAAYGTPTFDWPAITSTPAVGVIDDDEGKAFAYVTLFGATSELNSSNLPCDYLTDPGCYRANLCALAFDGAAVERRIGITSNNWGSPVLHDNGDILLPCDDVNIYTFDNRLDGDPFLPTRWSPAYLGPTAFSATAGVFPDRTAVIWHEQGGVLCRIEDTTASGLTVTDNAGGIGYSVGGAPALDSAARFFANTDRTPYRVVARKNELDLDANRFLIPWKRPGTSTPVAYSPPTIVIDSVEYVLAQRFESAPAIDADGTIVCTNEGFILALRPLLGDFNGDGCRNNFDIDAFVLAILFPEQWESGAEEDGEGFGARFGINLLGVGDCNNDGHFNNADIDCFVTWVLDHPTCPEGDEDKNGDEEESLTFGANAGQQAATSCASEPSEQDMEHFWAMIALVRSYFGEP